MTHNSRMTNNGATELRDEGAELELRRLLVDEGLKLSDADLDIIARAVVAAFDAGFRMGWGAALNYNNDCDERLLDVGPPMNH